MLVIGLLAGGGVILADQSHQSRPGAPVAADPLPPPPSPSVLPAPNQSPPGGSINVAGSRNKRTVACNESTAFISGVDNTVTLTGHCTRVDVSGVQNTVTVNASDTIVVSGVRNTVVFLTGTPQLEKSGIDNTINGR